jgi:hypothetical protein
VLPLGGPRDEVVPKEHSITECRTASVGIASPISIRISDQISNQRAMKLKVITKGTSNILENPFDQGEMRFPWVMQKVVNLLNIISNVWAGECEVL